MKITEILTVQSKPKDTTSCGTTSSGSSVGSALHLVPEMVDNKVLCQPDHSAIAEGVSQIFRRKKGGAPTKGFRCTSGPRKGRIVAKPSTCFQKTDPQKSAKIRKKRAIKAKIAGKKLGITKRSRAGSRRLKGVQIKKTKGSQPRHGKSSRSGSRPLMKSKTVKPK
tara:strand:+ start:376 stop:873 length:498 start_codon:yes stop_codon:yes gene_type:complete